MIGETVSASDPLYASRGVTVFVGHAPENTPVEFDARMLMPEKMVIGSMYGTARPHVDFPRLVSSINLGNSNLDELVTVPIR